MFDGFFMNGYGWTIESVRPDSRLLVDRTGSLTLATTDPVMRTIYLSNNLRGELLTTVLLHELGHCVLFSFDLIGYIHSVVRPEYWIEAEEWICNFLANYGRIAFMTLYEILGEAAWYQLPFELERLVA